MNETPAGADGGPDGGNVVDVTYYTDPLCSWSWAFEPQWRRLRWELGDQVRWRYRMGGLLRDWASFHDPLNDVASPSHMGPRWYEVSELTGMPIDPALWHEDPPASSYPACLAVKTAELQGATAGEWYLRRVREAVMLHRRNVAKRDVLLDVAASLSRDPAVPATFDAERFEADLGGPAALEALRSDLRDAREHDIGRFPTLVLRAPGVPGLLLVGYRPYEALRSAVQRAAGGRLPPAASRDVGDYERMWPGLTARERAEVSGAAVPGTRPHGLEDRALDPSLSPPDRRPAVW